MGAERNVDNSLENQLSEKKLNYNLKLVVTNCYSMK